MYRIGAVVYVERSGQKSIVIGKKGEQLKLIGQDARLEMEQLFGCKVFLQPRRFVVYLLIVLQ